jgi:hypothetical protein
LNNQTNVFDFQTKFSFGKDLAENKEYAAKCCVELARGIPLLDVKVLAAEMKKQYKIDHPPEPRKHTLN